MEFSLIFPVKEGYCDPDTVTKVAVAAEEEGFHSFLVWDHYMTPGGPNTLDAWALLAFVAGKTSSIGLGTVVTPIPFRPPAQLAKIVSTVDVLSGGRAILGVGPCRGVLGRPWRADHADDLRPGRRVGGGAA